jgi:uncharacterized protein (UPF0332 family)
MPSMADERESFMSKARESLASAESDLNGRRNSCANRCYYACFQAAIAALIDGDIKPTGQWEHGYVQGQFVGQLINRRKRYGTAHRRTLIDIMTLRLRADYELRSVTRTEATRALARSRALIQEIEERVNA